MDYDLLMKLILVGDSSCGKSSLLLRYSDDMFESNSLTTIGLDLRLKTQSINGKTCKIQMWDTAGQERFRTVTQSFYRGAHGIMLVFDLTNQESFDNLRVWHNDIKRNSNDGTAIYLVGNKSDQKEKRVVSRQDAEDLAEMLDVKYFETSAKTCEGVHDVFQSLLEDLFQSRSFLSNRTSSPQETIRDIKPKEPKMRGCPIWPW